MSKINAIQQAIMQLDGGEYQKLMDEYLYKKFKYTNIETLGSHTASNKVTKGIPDSYIKLDNGKYVLIMYGTVESTSYKKIEDDIKSCLDTRKLNIAKNDIEEIVCCYTSTNISIKQKQTLERIDEEIKITLVGISSVSYDLLIHYPTIAKDHLQIPIDTGQIYEVNDFIDEYDRSKMNASINMKLVGREKEIDSIMTKLDKDNIVLLYGKSGVGKTRLALEVASLYRDKLNYKVVCIKNNGQMIYNDLKYYISEAGNYLIFIDDANQTIQLDHAIDYVVSPPKGINVKIIMTVRDYARELVRKIIYNKLIPQEEEIDILKDEVIRKILEDNLNIKNNLYLDQILKISRGNPRLAVLAGKVSKKEGLKSIYNSIDIFKHYYGGIIEEKFFDSKKVIVTFIITLFGGIEYHRNEIAIKVLNELGINEDEFIQLCYELNNNEIIDLYMEQVVKVSDQSLGDYIMYHVIIEKKYIKLEKIIKYLFNGYRDRLIYVLNTIIRLFNSEECIRYIEDQVNIVWDTIEDDNYEFEYIKSFHAFNEDKSLLYIKRKIDKLDSDNVVLDNFDLKGKENNNTIKSELVQLLASFKYYENYEIIIELAIYYYKKKPSKSRDFYLLFSEAFGYDKHSLDNEYKYEFLNITHLWEASNNGKDNNLVVLILNVIKKYIGFKFNTTESIGIRSINFITINLVKCDGLDKLREVMWSILGILYKNDKYKSEIDRILLSYNAYGNSTDDIKSIYEFDFKYIKKYLFNSINSQDFIQCKILRKFEKIHKRLGITEDIIFNSYKENFDFLTYNTLIKSHEYGGKYEEEERLRKENIYNMIKDYNEDHFIRMFNLFNYLLINEIDIKEWEIQSGIAIMFDLLKKQPEKYVIAINLYLKYNTPFEYYTRDKVCTLIDEIGIEETEKIIFKYEYNRKNQWIYELLFCILPEKRTKKYSEILKYTFKNELLKDNPMIPNIQNINLYSEIDKNIVYDLSINLLENFKDRMFLVQSFLGNCYKKSEAEIIYDIYRENMSLLENIYLIGIDDDIDYNGNLFVLLASNNIEFLITFVEKNLEKETYSHNKEIFKSLWEVENYEELIDTILETFINVKGKVYLGLYNSYLNKIFSNDQKTTDIIKTKKIEFIRNYIDKFYLDIDRVNMIFQIVASVFESNKLELLLYFIKKNKDIKIFKKISLFPSLKSWSGSEVPIIESEIEFLKNFNNSITGLDYIEHKSYLKERIKYKEKYKQKVLLKEYLEDRDL